MHTVVIAPAAMLTVTQLIFITRAVNVVQPYDAGCGIMLVSNHTSWTSVYTSHKGHYCTSQF